MIKPFVIFLSLAWPALALGQTNAAPAAAPAPPPLPPPPDPATLAVAETVEVKTPAPPLANWKNWIEVPAGTKVEKDVTYGTGGGHPLLADIAYPENPPKTPMPAIIWIHGGAWHGQDKFPNYPLYFTTQGYFTASINYRLDEEAPWPAQIEDCKCAVRWLRANAAKYNVDPDHIGVWGQSAGGQLVSCLGTQNDPTLEGDGGWPGVSSKVQAVCDWFGPEDMKKYGWQEIGMPITKFAKQYDQASPILNIKADQPPFLVVQGDADTAVPYKDSIDFVAAMVKAGAPVQLITVHGGGHGFGVPKGAPPAQPGMQEILARMTQFFDSNLKK